MFPDLRMLVLQVGGKVLLLPQNFEIKTPLQVDGKKFEIIFQGQNDEFFMTVTGKEKKRIMPMDEFKVGNAEYKILAIGFRHELKDHGLDVAQAPDQYMEMEFCVGDKKHIIESHECATLGCGKFFFENNTFYYLTDKDGKGKNKRACKQGDIFVDGKVKIRIIVIREIVE